MEKYGRKESWIVIRFGKHGRKISWILKWFGKYGRKHGKDMKNMEQTQVEMWKWYGKYGRNTSWNL